MPFTDRTDAGKRLAEALLRYQDMDIVVLALPRGGLPVAIPIAKSLNAPLDLLLVRKIGVPFNPEYAMGAVMGGDHPVVIRNDDTIAALKIDPDMFEAAKNKELKELERRKHTYRPDGDMVAVKGKTVILVDDGIATGATVQAALQGLKRLEPEMIVLAVPVAPRDQIEQLSKEADDFVCLEELGRCGAISLHYDHFEQLTDDEVIVLLASLE